MSSDYTVAAGLVRESRLEQKKLERDLAQRLAPHKVMIEQISKPYVNKIAVLEGQEKEALEIWRALHVSLTDHRRAALLRGEDVPPLELPADVSLREDRVIEVTDASVLPEEYKQPNLKAIRASEGLIRGTTVSLRPTLVCR